ncbi:hypothetical protein DesfrDRAFT_0173 [Solidesulfovibrio fructosivorans JJ]]|uniref:Uncharacterized protein n=1 Tax=Solidesulfovibrio fructosivorans JJ] TaxID=596151 RepID=E1JRC4_SOLFR|nr:DUF2569 family protein [Solidesulfovibrio fructosivorans]EFL53125.1 hypothetical protein DesfrDRAFT_0173 [Solidesulfovibrio fructosivorans JJ]]
MDKPTIDSLISAGTDYCELNDFTNAFSCFNKVLQTDSTNNEALFGRGVCYLKTNKKENGVADIRTAAKFGNTYAKEFLTTPLGENDSHKVNGTVFSHPDYSSKYYGIKGWLAFLCVVLVLSPLLTLGKFGEASGKFNELLIKYKQLSQSVSPDHPSFFKIQTTTLALIKAKYIITTLFYFSYALLFTGITAVIYIYRRNKKGIAYAKAYIVATIIINCIYPILMYKALNLGIDFFINTSGVQFILSLSFGIAWLLYLNKSKRIKATFGV